MSQVLRRNGWSHQVPARRTLKRDEEAGRMGEGSLSTTGGSSAVALKAWTVFEDEAGFSTPPPTSRTWAQRGRAAVRRVMRRTPASVSRLGVGDYLDWSTICWIERAITARAATAASILRVTDTSPVIVSSARIITTMIDVQGIARVKIPSSPSGFFIVPSLTRTGRR